MIMGNWRRQKGYDYNPEIIRTKLDNKKPPLGNWQPTVPSWEKKFCKLVGGISWNKIMEMKRYMHLYDNVVQWDDSAGEEAFHNAKKRFYAKIHGLPCNISLPDPNIYLDEIDWNSQIDPKLLQDLDCKQPVIPNAEKEYAGVVILDSLFKDQGFSSSGWGDCEEKVKKNGHSSLGNDERDAEENGWGDFGNNMQCWDESNGNSGWGDGKNRNETNDRGEWGEGWNSNNSWGQIRNENNNRGEWEDGWNSKGSWGQNRYENNNNREEWGDGWNSNNSWGQNKYENNNSWGRYKTARFKGEEDRRNQKWRNQSGRKKVNFTSKNQSRNVTF